MFTRGVPGGVSGAQPLRLFERHQDKVNGGATGITHFMAFAEIEGIHPAYRASRHEYWCGLHPLSALRPGAALDVNVDLVAGMTVDARPLSWLDLNPLYDHPVILQQLFQWHIGVDLRCMLNPWSNRCAALEGHVDQVDGGIAGIAGFMFYAEWDCIHPAHFPVGTDYSRVLGSATETARPLPTLDVNIDLVAGMTVDPLPFPGVHDEPLQDDVIVC